MKIGIIDADLIGRQKHRFPNLACEKISGYWKEKGAEVHLLLEYIFPVDYDHIYISKVFTDTDVPALPIDEKRIHIGGTGFYFDKAPNLPDEIEHHMPDYHLYDEWINSEVEKAEAEKAAAKEAAEKEKAKKMEEAAEQSKSKRKKSKKKDSTFDD